jgi:hypothetical protein
MNSFDEERNHEEAQRKAAIHQALLDTNKELGIKEKNSTNSTSANTTSLVQHSNSSGNATSNASLVHANSTTNSSLAANTTANSTISQIKNSTATNSTSSLA